VRAELINCILWDEAAATGSLIALQGTDERQASLIVSYSDVKGGADGIVKKGVVSVTWGAKNMDRDPRLQNPAGADGVVGTGDDSLRLVAGSPCIDAGNNTAVPADADDVDLDQNRAERTSLDADGLARFVDDTGTTNTGLADLPAYPRIVDLGAFEFAR
jgi:hypothetical protein